MSAPFALKSEGEVPESAIILGEQSGEAAITDLGYTLQGDTIGSYYLYKKDAYNPSQPRVPQRIAYQGRLLPADGATVGATADLTFTVYDANTAGAPLWTETRNNVPLDQGLFSVELGAVNPIYPTHLSDKDLWLGVSVNGEALLPREKLASVGYALKVESPVPEGGIVLSSTSPNTELAAKKFSATGTSLQGYYLFRKNVFSSADSSVPLLINYQGRMRDVGGGLISGNTVDLHFSMFDTVAGSTPLWSETVSSVSLDTGILNTLLGGSVPITPATFTGPNAFLEVKVIQGATIETLSPRQRLTSVPFSLQSDGTMPLPAMILADRFNDPNLLASGFLMTGDTLSHYYIYGREVVDTDADGMPDWWENGYTCVDALTGDSQLDADTDSLLNLAEYLAATDPCDPDTDGDGLSDGAEVCDGSTCLCEPVQCSYPGGCIGDTDPLNPDTDYDGIPDNVDLDPLQGQITGAIALYEGTYTNYGYAAEPFRYPPPDPEAPAAPIVVQVSGAAGSTPANALVKFSVFEYSNQTPESGEAAGFCADPANCDPVSPFYAYTDINGEARVYLKFGKKTWGGDAADGLYGCPASPYTQICGVSVISAVANPLEPDEVVLNSSSFPFSGQLISLAGAVSSLQLVQGGFQAGDTWVLYSENLGDTRVRALDAYGNRVANAMVNFAVSQGGGKVMNRMARFCRDNAGDPFASVCMYDPDVALQSVEVPAVLDNFTVPRFGPHDCTCLADGATANCAGWNPDEQCSSTNWWSNSYGEASANWIMGPLPTGIVQGSTMGPFNEGLIVSVFDNSTVESITVQGHAIDIPAHDMIARNLNLSSRSNSYIQDAGDTMVYPFRTVIQYRHDQASDPDALPLVRIDDSLSSTDLPPGEFRVGYFVTYGGVSNTAIRSGQETPYLELPLLDDGSTDPTDRARAYWHLDCDWGAEKIIYMQAIHFSPWTSAGSVYQQIHFWINPSYGPCVNQGELAMVDPVSGATLDRLPFYPQTFKLKAQTWDGSPDPITVKLTSYDRSGLPIIQQNPPDPQHPETLDVTLSYSPTFGYHVSTELAAQTAGASPPGTFVADTGAGQTNFHSSGSGSNRPSSKVMFAADGSYANQLGFDKIIGTSGINMIYVKLELARGPAEALQDPYSLPYCVAKPGDDCMNSGQFQLTLQAGSTLPIATYERAIDPATIHGNTQDAILEYATFDTDHPEAGYEFGFQMNGNLADPPMSRGEAVYPIGWIGITKCDDFLRHQQQSSCDDMGDYLTTQLENRSRIRADEVLETPYLDTERDLFKAGGVVVLKALLGTGDKAWLRDQADVIYFSGQGDEDGTIYLRYDSGADSKLNPKDDLKPANDWQIDADIVILMACEQLSLCDDYTFPPLNDVGYDPTCNVKYLDGGTWKTGYDQAHPPTGGPDNICQQCTRPVADYGAQRWRGLTTKAGSTVVGPKVYLGYYGVVDGQFIKDLNTDTKVIQKLIENMKIWDFTQADWRVDRWINEWLEANLNIYYPANESNDSRPAAAIDARDPDNMKYYALRCDPIPYPAFWWKPGTPESAIPIYNDLDP